MIGFLRKTFPCSGVRNFYTTTEAGRAWTMREYPPLGTESPAPVASRGEAPGLLAGIDEFSLVGRPVPGTEVKITDPDHRRLPPRTIGSVWLRVTDGHSREYARYSDDEREVFRDGWVRTGDLGMLDEDGALYLAGRESDTLNVGGINVSAQQIEAALLSHDAVAEAAVLAVPHETLEQQIVAAVVMRPGAARSVGPPLREFVRERLGAAKTPARIVVLASLPRNGMGKVVKAELATVLGQGIIGAPAAEPERPDAESIGQAVREAWESSLGVRVRDPGKLDSTDFVALGGDSMTAVEIADALGGRLGWRVSPADVFRYPTPGLLTEALTARRGEGSG
jgi:acyl-CoA synthetase (AMP-forming)/AMP-acid ligase II/acyl carrier protein